MEDTKNTICAICGANTIGEYCHNCGQQNTGKRLNFGVFVKEVIFSLFDMERSVLGTFLLILRNPARIINNYWDGYRRYYSPPGKLIVYFLLVIGIHVIIHDNLIFGLTLDINGIAPQFLFLLLFLSFLTISSYVTYIKQKRTLLEHSISTIYIFCCWTIIMIILYDIIIYLLKSDDDNFVSVFILLGMIFIWTARTFCNKNNWVIIALNAVAQLLVFAAILALLTAGLYYYSPVNVSFDGL
ncbi:hypothetical protein JYU23_00025 [bacterium AH-315-C07]|nr:hypothetical protein [bacterium AH-315-C07]